jgi:hypothetical protein
MGILVAEIGADITLDAIDLRDATLGSFQKRAAYINSTWHFRPWWDLVLALLGLCRLPGGAASSKRGGAPGASLHVHMQERTSVERRTCILPMLR